MMSGWIVDEPSILAHTRLAAAQYHYRSFGTILEEFLAGSGLPSGSLEELCINGVISFDDDDMANPGFQAQSFYWAATGSNQIMDGIMLKVRRLCLKQI
jgi:hypothetical protein